VYAVISCSLDSNSKSSILGHHAYQRLSHDDHPCHWIALRDYDLPLSNGYNQSAYAHADVKYIHDLLLTCKGIIFSSPIYNWDVSAASKNLIELVGTSYKNILSGKALNDKVIGFIGVGQVSKSYLAPLGFLNSLMLDFRCLILPRFVFASHEDFQDNQPSEDILKRVNKLVSEFATLATAVHTSNIHELPSKKRAV